MESKGTGSGILLVQTAACPVGGTELWQASSSCSRSPRLGEVEGIGANLEPELRPGGWVSWRLHIGLLEDLATNVWERKDALTKDNSDRIRWDGTQLLSLPLTPLTSWLRSRPAWQINSLVPLEKWDGCVNPAHQGLHAVHSLISWVPYPTTQETSRFLGKLWPGLHFQRGK